MRNFLVFEPNQVEWAAISRNAPHFGRKNYGSRAMRAGIKYERRAQGYLNELYPDTYVESPWLMFRLRREPMLRWCQPDGMVVDIERGILLIVEIKLRHCAEAYTQINGIYHPVLHKIFPGFAFRQVEVTRWYDPATHFPVPVQLVSSLSLVPSGRFGVHIWN